MSDDEQITPMLPLATKSLRLNPGELVPAIEEGSPFVVRFSMAAIDPHANVTDKKTPTTLRYVRIRDEEEEEENDDDEDDDFDGEPVTLLTLSPQTQYQQSIDLTILPTEHILFQVVGPYPIHLTGSLVEHPITQEIIDELEEDDEDDEDDDDEDDEDDEAAASIGDVLDLEAEVSDDDDDEEEEEEEEVDVEEDDDMEDDDEEEEEKPQPKSKADKKRALEDEANNKKKVKFSAALEQGPTESKYPIKKLAGGVVVEERKAGNGVSAKRGSRVSMRYVGKLANGKVFDKNTSGRAFSFSLGKNEVIKGWDVGIAGMKAGAERRIVIPAPMAYGNQSLPGIPKNSTLTFDVKCVEVK